jgi:outer membrane protein W
MTKKIVVLGLVLATVCLAYPQTKKGDLIIGTYVGSTGVGFSSSESGNSSTTALGKSDYSSFSIGVGPSVGYFIADNLAIGTSFSLSYNWNKSKSSNTASPFTSESSSGSVYFSLGPFGRYYFGANGGKGMPYVQVGFGISLYPKYSGTYTPSSGTGYDYGYKTYFAWNASVQVGYEHFLNPHVGLQFYVGYSFNHYKNSYEYKYPDSPSYISNYKSTNHGIAAGVGVSIHLTKKEKALPPPPPPPPAPKKKK